MPQWSYGVQVAAQAHRAPNFRPNFRPNFKECPVARFAVPPLNDQVAAAFEELADLLHIAGGDRFKVVAYRRVADQVKALSRDIGLFGNGELVALSGVGKATAAKIQEVLETGTMAKLEEARTLVPAGVRELTALPGLGPKTALLLHDELGINSLAELEKAVKEGRLEGVKGLGPKTAQNLGAALSFYRGKERRVGLDVALSVAESMLQRLRALPQVQEATYCGSLRRMRETIGDLDLLVASNEPGLVMSAFVDQENLGSVIARGSTKSSITTAEGLQVDLRVVAPEAFGAAQQYFTGSKEHNVRLREIAIKQGYKLSEYGLFRVADGMCVAGRTEQQIYATLGLQTPPPTLRENRGEVEAARSGVLPVVIELADIRGDLHSHTSYSDGSASVREMALAAIAQGHRYLAITDHLDAWVKSHTVESIREQAQEIALVNRELEGRITVLQGVEVDIGIEGDLALPEEILELVDLVIASIHRRFGLDPQAMTRRVLKALRHPRVNIFGHPTGRWLGKRPAAEFDLPSVFECAAHNGVALEVNANPARLDLKDDHLRLAKEYGCRFTISTDSHCPAHLARMRLGVGMAQRGWLSAPEVLNTLSVEELRNNLSKC
ncbi:MAG: DNA polymerase/3'-5' exonuclease PolX [Actinomycetota bacterium]